MAENAASTPSSSTVQTLNIQHLILTKLDCHNYILWRTQFIPLLKGNELEGYVDGSLSCPPCALQRQICCRIYHIESGLYHMAQARSNASRMVTLVLLETTLTQVVRLSTSKDVWLALEINIHPDLALRSCKFVANSKQCIKAICQGKIIFKRQRNFPTTLAHHEIQ